MLKYEDEKAIHLLTTIIKTHQFPPTLTTLAELLRLTGHHSKAKQYYQKTLDLDSTDEIALKGMALLCHEMRD